MAAIAEMFDAERLAALAGHGALSERPVFIVGMPRSGTTLAEQIISAHPAVHGAGERPHLAHWIARSRNSAGAPADAPGGGVRFGGGEVEEVGSSSGPPLQHTGTRVSFGAPSAAGGGEGGPETTDRPTSPGGGDSGAPRLGFGLGGDNRVHVGDGGGDGLDGGSIVGSKRFTSVRVNK